MTYVIILFRDGVYNRLLSFLCMYFRRIIMHESRECVLNMYYACIKSKFQMFVSDRLKKIVWMDVLPEKFFLFIFVTSVLKTIMCKAKAACRK